MQEEVENRTLTLVVSGTKFTGRLMKAAITKYLAHRKEKKLQKQKSRDTPVIPHGKQTVKQLIGQNQGVSNIEITDPSIKEFEKIARKYGVDYAVKKDRSSSPPKYLIFFKGRDADALTAAFTEYTGKKVKKAEKTERPSVLAKLNQFKELVKNAVVDRTKRKELERRCHFILADRVSNDPGFSSGIKRRVKKRSHLPGGNPGFSREAAEHLRVPKFDMIREVRPEKTFAQLLRGVAPEMRFNDTPTSLSCSASAAWS